MDYKQRGVFQHNGVTLKFVNNIDSSSKSDCGTEMSNLQVSIFTVLGTLCHY